MPRKAAEERTERREETAEEAPRGRAFWSGVLTFGLVSIPVELLPATRKATTPLRLLGNSGAHVERRYYCPEHDEDVPREHIVRGYETKSGEYVPVTDEELDALDPKKSREIDLRLFVPKDSVPPVYFDKAYFLVPSAESGKAYALLTQTLEARGRAGIATFVMREREYWVAIFASDGLLRAETLRFREYVRSPEDVGLPALETPDEERVTELQKLMRELHEKALPTAELYDEHAKALAELAKKKARAGKDVVAVEDAAKETPLATVVDLMEVLKQRLAESGFDVKGAAAASKTENRKQASETKPKPGVRKARTTKRAAPRARKNATH